MSTTELDVKPTVTESIAPPKAETGSQSLATGDSTSSVVDPNSPDPTISQKPETSSLGQDLGAAGVGSGAALATASTTIDKCKSTSIFNIL
jgi:hypothetical protein